VVQAGFGLVGVDEVGEQGDGGGGEVLQRGVGGGRVALKGPLNGSGEQVCPLIQAVGGGGCFVLQEAFEGRLVGVADLVAVHVVAQAAVLGRQFQGGAGHPAVPGDC